MFETFLFVSLAITFILIVFLVYHFKSRITMVEHKCDTMFEIINNIVAEMNNTQNELHHSTNPEIQSNQDIYTHNKIDIVLSDDESGSDDESDSVNSNMRVININNVQDMDTVDSNYYHDNDNNDTHIEGVDEINDVNVEPLNTDNLEMHIEKVEETTNNLDDESTVSTYTETKHSMSIFKKMTLPLLKTYVIEKGLITDPSKMKKQDLINLIETNDI